MLDFCGKWTFASEKEPGQTKIIILSVIVSKSDLMNQKGLFKVTNRRISEGYLQKPVVDQKISCNREKGRSTDGGNFWNEAPSPAIVYYF